MYLRPLLLLSIVMFFYQSSHAQSQFGYGMDATTLANGRIIASPPLPMLYFKAGTQKFTVEPGYVTGNLNTTDATDSGAVTTGQISGGGGAIAYNYARHDWGGFYIMILGDSVSGNINYAQQSGCGSTCEQVNMANIKGAYGTLTFGGHVTWIGGRENDFFSFGTFGGPAVTAASLSQRVTISTGNTVTDDFEMKSNPIFPTFLFGVQFGFRFSNYLVINPYYMGNWAISTTCVPYQVTQTYVQGPNTGASVPYCGGPNGNATLATTTNQIEIKGDFQAIGVNVGIPALGLSLNAYTYPVQTAISTTVKNMQMNAYVVALTLGGGG